VENVTEARQSFQMLTDAAPPESVDVWNSEILEAEAARGISPKSMDIMHSRIKTGQTLKSISSAVIQEDLDKNIQTPNSIGTTDWLVEGLNLEDEQCVLGLIRFLRLMKCRIRIRQLVRKAGRHPTPDDILHISRQRQRLASRMNDFHITSNRLLGVSRVSAVLGRQDVLSDDGYVSDEIRSAEDLGDVGFHGRR
jgi:hypothetical protein